MTSVIWAIGIYATLFVLDFFCLRANPAPRAKVTHRGGGICLGSTFFQPGARLTFWRPDGFVNYVQPCLEKGVALEGKATFHTSLPSHSL